MLLLIGCCRLQDFDGLLLVQYRRMQQVAPQFFYHTLEDMLQLSLPDILHFSAAIEALKAISNRRGCRLEIRTAEERVSGLAAGRSVPFNRLEAAARVGADWHTLAAPSKQVRILPTANIFPELS